MIITCAGFYGTGSSAITNLFCECENSLCLDDEYELRFIHDPDGISDLEYNLLENPNRHNTSHAIKRFKQMIDRNTNRLTNHHYEKIFNGQFKKISYEYIDDISDFKYNAVWHGDAWLYGKLFTIVNRFATKILSKIHSVKNGLREQKICRFGLSDSLLSKKEIAYAGTFDKNRFISATQKYIDRLIKASNNNNAAFLVFDQMLPPTNINRYVRYFPSNAIRVFVVERDPRDLYLLEKLIWGGGVIPHVTPNIFCDWFLWTRGQYEIFKLPKEAMFIRFEDLIYKYAETIDEMFRFAGIKKECHIKPKSILIPEISKQNTRLWERFNGYSKEMAVIERRLARYCYDYTLLS